MVNDLEKDALSVTDMEGVGRVVVLPDDHPAILRRNARYEAEAQAKRDARRIDANHHIAGDVPRGTVKPYLNGQPIDDVTECYVGETGWLLRNLRDENGHICLVGDGVAQERLTGHVELREI
jgi:hypothetical protein